MDLNDFKKSKKGDLHIGFLTVYVLPFMFLMLVMGFILYAVTLNYSSAYLSYSPNLENNIYAYRAINVCLAYQEPFTQRFYPGIIDISKYNLNNLEKCYSQTTTTSFNLKLIDLDKDKTYDTIRVGFGASLRQLSYPITIKNEDGSISKGILYFGVSE